MSENEEDVTKIATMVIIHAGNARSLVNEAIQAVEKNDVETAKVKISQANAEIKAAHQTQTEVIQGEARGESIRLTMLLTHAQDSLMIAMSEVHMAKYIIRLHTRIGELENALGAKK